MSLSSHRQRQQNYRLGHGWMKPCSPRATRVDRGSRLSALFVYKKRATSRPGVLPKNEGSIAYRMFREVEACPLRTNPIFFFLQKTGTSQAVHFAIRLQKRNRERSLPSVLSGIHIPKGTIKSRCVICPRSMA